MKTIKHLFAWAVCIVFIIITFSLYWFGYLPYYLALGTWLLNDKICLLSKHVLGKLGKTAVFAKKKEVSND